MVDLVAVSSSLFSSILVSGELVTLTSGSLMAILAVLETATRTSAPAGGAGGGNGLVVGGLTPPAAWIALKTFSLPPVATLPVSDGSLSTLVRIRLITC